ncbi:hypothetical protein CpipJ_CPIJ018170 [Culex quinquefasciatus]|uniref:Uncharacterized protein n=1 Tax=Culex quinquefasciatus TaxID=7176 RepID=B0XF60_CULQU|nr:hypothetical protein CpipJ_CPIJ018170 [Culex quinquefasciatus]|eukprot:XP_001868282.1 hypothetical protein CpipJ_CPIJ018170 [Culex quinquefasciatus]
MSRRGHATLALRTSTEVPTTFPTTSPPRIILTPTTTTNQLTQHHTDAVPHLSHKAVLKNVTARYPNLQQFPAQYPYNAQPVQRINNYPNNGQQRMILPKPTGSGFFHKVKNINHMNRVNRNPELKNFKIEELRNINTNEVEAEAFPPEQTFVEPILYVEARLVLQTSSPSHARPRTPKSRVDSSRRLSPGGSSQRLSPGGLFSAAKSRRTLHSG